MKVQRRGQLWKTLQRFKLFAMNTSASEWEELYANFPVQLLPWESGQPSPTLVRLVEDKKISGMVLDVGCGAGTHAVWMAEQGLQVFGVDISVTAIEHAQRLAVVHGVQVKFRVGNALQLHFENAKFDAIFDRGTYHHQVDKDAYVQELNRVLKAGGTYLLLAFSPTMHWPKSVDRQEIQKLFGQQFTLDRTAEEIHIQPDTRKVVLAAYVMTRRNGDRP